MLLLRKWLMAVKTLTSFTPQLVTAIRDRVLRMSDHCLAKGLISNEAYKTVLESNNSTDSKARVLLMAVKDTIATDGSLFDIMLGILKEVAFSISAESDSDSSKPMLIAEMESKYEKLIKPDSDRQHKRTASDPVEIVPDSMHGYPKSSQHRFGSMSMLPSSKLETVTVASKVKVIERFTPRLVSAISSSIEEVSDECLASGLISNGTYRRVLEPTSINKEDKARRLLLKVKKNIQSDGRCFILFLNALKTKLPIAISDTLVSEIKMESERLTSVPALNAQCCASSADPSLEVSESLNFCDLLDKFEEATAILAEVKVEKRILEKELEVKVKENEELKAELNRIKAESRESENAERIKHLNEVIAEHECEVSKLEVTVREKQEEIDECHMSLKRERTMIEKESKAAADLRREARELEAEMRKNLKEQNDKLQEENNQLHQKKDEIEQKNGELQSENDTLQQEKYRLEQDNRMLQQAIDHFPDSNNLGNCTIS